MRSHVLLAVHFVAQGTILTLMRLQAHQRRQAFVITWAIAASTTLLTSLILLTQGRLPYIDELANHPTHLLIGSVLFIGLGGAFFVSTYARFVASTLLPSYVEGPLSRLSLLLVVCIAVLGLREVRSGPQILGIALSFLPLLILQFANRAKDQRDIAMSGLKWLGCSISCAAALQLSQTLLVKEQWGVAVPPLLYVLGMNLGTAIVAAAVMFVSPPTQNFTPELRTGGIIGVLNTISFTSQSMYLTHGDASIIFPFSSTTVVIPTVVLWLQRHERLPSFAEASSVLVAIAAAVLLAWRS